LERLSILAVAIVLLALIKAQGAGGIEFGREPEVPPEGRNQTRFTGRADHVNTRLSTTIYRGNVSIAFPDAMIVLTADEVIEHHETHELTVSGKVRLQLDSQ
jgi:lipopolysaccharide assembly outer membrane protein LptD (OstA)